MKDFSRYGITANSFRKHEPDLPGADEPVSRTVVDIDNVKTRTDRPRRIAGLPTRRGR